MENFKAFNSVTKLVFLESIGYVSRRLAGKRNGVKISTNAQTTIDKSGVPNDTFTGNLTYDFTVTDYVFKC